MPPMKIVTRLRMENARNLLHGTSKLYLDIDKTHVFEMGDTGANLTLDRPSEGQNKWRILGEL